MNAQNYYSICLNNKERKTSSILSKLNADFFDLNEVFFEKNEVKILENLIVFFFEYY